MKNKIISGLRYFWYYYRIHTIIALAVLFIFGPMVWEMITAVHADYSVAIVSQQYYDDQTMAAFQQVLDERCEDLNGDGHIKVDVMYYQVDLKDPSKNDAGVSALDGDLIAGKSGLFLLEDPETFQRISYALTYLDGSEPEEESMDLERMLLPASECAALQGLGFDDLQIGLRLGHEQEAAYRRLLNSLMK